MAKFTPGTLWHSVLEQTERALACGALQRIPTRNTFLVDQRVRFLVPVVENIERKRNAGDEQKRTATNPFLPYDDDLYVGDISESHVGLLNKFNVVDHHLLIVTKTYEEQENALNIRDFEAMWICLAEFDGLAFYNAGVIAGASQPHKHLQQVPVPLGEGPGRTPMDIVMSSVELADEACSLRALPFHHVATRTEWCKDMSAIEAAHRTLALYEEMRDEVGLNKETRAYNFLATRDWMLLVPRKRECFQTISVNALGFAGSILVRNEAELEIVREHGPFEILKHVSFPIPS